MMSARGREWATRKAKGREREDEEVAQGDGTGATAPSRADEPVTSDPADAGRWWPVFSFDGVCDTERDMLPRSPCSSSSSRRIETCSGRRRGGGSAR